MYEALGPFGGGPPNKTVLELYRAWAAGGWGMILTGAATYPPGLFECFSCQARTYHGGP